MSNQNTIAIFSGGSRAGQLATLSNIGTTETAVSVIANPITGTGGGVAILAIPDPDQWVNGDSIRVYVGGTITTNATTNVAVKLYQGTDSNTSNDHVLVNTAAVNANTQTTQFLIDATLQYDSVSQTIHGLATTEINGTVVGPAASTLVSSIVSASSLQFVVSGVFGVSNAGNSITVDEFRVDAV